MSENDSGGLGLLRLDDVEAGTTVQVRSTGSSIGASSTHTAYVDEDGIVRQEGNGAAFNKHAYEVAEK